MKIVKRMCFKMCRKYTLSKKNYVYHFEDNEYINKIFPIRSNVEAEHVMCYHTLTKKRPLKLFGYHRRQIERCYPSKL